MTTELHFYLLVVCIGTLPVAHTVYLATPLFRGNKSCEKKKGVCLGDTVTWAVNRIKWKWRHLIVGNVRCGAKIQNVYKYRRRNIYFKKFRSSTLCQVCQETVDICKGRNSTVECATWGTRKAECDVDTDWDHRLQINRKFSDVWLTVHRNSVWIKKPTRCHFLYSLFLF